MVPLVLVCSLVLVALFVGQYSGSASEPIQYYLLQWWSRWYPHLLGYHGCHVDLNGAKYRRDGYYVPCHWYVFLSVHLSPSLIPMSGGFYTLISRFIDPSWGFAMGWNYVAQWAVVLPLELTAAAFTVRYWDPNGTVNIAVWITIFFVVSREGFSMITVNQ